MNAAQIRALLSRAQLGLVPYRNTPDLIMSVPNKVGEYLAAGVPVAACLQGTLARLLSVRHCGLQFEAREPASLVTLVRRLRDDAHLRTGPSAQTHCWRIGKSLAVLLYTVVSLRVWRPSRLPLRAIGPVFPEGFV